MDILHLCHQFAPETRGGVEAYVQDLIEAQHAAGHDVHVLTGSQAPWPEVGIEQLQVGPVPVHRLHRDDLFFDLYSKSWHPGVETVLDEFLRRHRPKVVHVHQWIRLTSNLVEIVQRTGLPAVVTLHDYYASCPRAFRLRLDGSACLRELSPASCLDCVPRYGHEREAELAAGIELFAEQSRAELTMADAVLVGVASTADLVSTTLGLSRERFEVMSLGYRRRFPGLPPLAPPDPSRPFRFAFWGGVAPHKGLRGLVDAVRELQRERPARPFELHVLGGFASAAFEVELRERARGLPITFHGSFATAQLRTLHPAVGVFPSTCLETFGIVLDECFELGLPCIVSDRGALAVRAGDGGLRTPAGDARALAAAMRRFVDETQLWTQLRRRLPELPPALEQHVRDLDAVYAAAARRRAAAGAPAGGIPLMQRVRVLLAQRESALGRLPVDDRR
ncbi:MAG TPA: glycosyltransferase [Planctomycetota bacterium]|nr:glycosyltransferase [Planctomycetota bacterium]